MFIEQMEEQLGLLTDYCDLYDAGKFGHGLSIAARLAVIIEMLRKPDGGAFVQETGLRLLSNASPMEAHHKRTGYHPLAVANVSGTTAGPVSARFDPLLQRPASIRTAKQMKIGAWTGEHVLQARHAKSLSRFQLFHTMRNKQGGAHPYSTPEPNYAAASAKQGLGMYAIGPYGQVDYDPPAHLATIRHMAHELKSSISAVL